MASFTIHTALSELRYSNKADRFNPQYVLQQRWKIESQTKGVSFEWRDVPRVDE